MSKGHIAQPRMARIDTCKIEECKNPSVSTVEPVIYDTPYGKMVKMPYEAGKIQDTVNDRCRKIQVHM